MDKAVPNTVWHVALVVCTRERRILMPSDYNRSYLGAVEGLQNSLAQSVMTQLVVNRGQYTTLNALCFVVDLTSPLEVKEGSGLVGLPSPKTCG